jgi:hypothetical protein
MGDVRMADHFEASTELALDAADQLPRARELARRRTIAGEIAGQTDSDARMVQLPDVIARGENVTDVLQAAIGMSKKMVADAGPFVGLDVVMGDLIRGPVAIDATGDVMNDDALDIGGLARRVALRLFSS